MTNQVNQAFEKWWYGTIANLILCSRDSAEVGYQAATQASEQRIQELESEIANLHTVMMAAAIEITEHWEAHCDEDGCGPANLVRRLENGYPEQYGYDAKTMVRMDKQIDDLTASNNHLREALVMALNCVDEEINPNNYNGEILTNFIHDYGRMIDILQNALSSTPAQSLAEHDNATIERSLIMLIEK